MTGMERNADVVHMTAYAPLFAHIEGWQWRPDLIWFDNLRMMRSSSYYVQQLYATNKGTHVLPLTMNKKPVTGAEEQHGLFASAVWDADKQTIIVKVANTSDRAQSLTLNFAGMKKNVQLVDGKCITLHGEDDSENTLDNPMLIMPNEQPIVAEGQAYSAELGAQTVAIYSVRQQYTVHSQRKVS